MERVRVEIEMLKQKYPSLTHGQNLDWIMIPDFPLPKGWNREKKLKLIGVYPEE